MEDKAAQLQEQLRLMSANYAAQLPEKINQIEEPWASLQSEWSDETFQMLHGRVHSLTGSGATFGFDLLTDAARTLEVLIKKIIAEKQTPPSPAYCDEINLYIKALRDASAKAFLKSKSQEKSIVVAPSVSDSRSIFLMENDAHLAESLALQIGYFGYTVRIFTSIETARQAITREPPAVLICDISSPNEPQGGIHLLESMSQEPDNTIPTIFISSHNELEYRLQAVRAGGYAYFTKPVDIPRLIEKLESLTSNDCEDTFRILIVDDSNMLADYYSAILNRVGMETVKVNDPLAVMEPLREFAPDLILMDVYMPGCSGLELAKVIRQQESFVSIPIVFLSAETDLEKQLQAMNLGGDDFLTKPIQPAHLISSVTARVRRSRILRAFMVRDSLTGLLNHTNIKSQLDIQLGRLKRQGGKLAFAMLDIDHFKSVNDNYGHPTGDRVIRSLARLLQQRLRAADVVGRYGGEEFAVIFNDTDGATAVKVLDEIRHDFGQIQHLHEKGEFNVTISAGVAEFPAISDAATLNEAADKALYQAKHGGRNRVILAEYA